MRVYMKDEHRRTETAKLVSWSLTSLFRDGEEAVMTAEAAATECNVTRTPDRHEQLSHDTSRRVLITTVVECKLTVLL